MARSLSCVQVLSISKWLVVQTVSNQSAWEAWHRVFSSRTSVSWHRVYRVCVVSNSGHFKLNVWDITSCKEQQETWEEGQMKNQDRGQWRRWNSSLCIIDEIQLLQLLPVLHINTSLFLMTTSKDLSRISIIYILVFFVFYWHDFYLFLINHAYFAVVFCS